MNRAAGDRQRGFLHRLGERRMGVAGARQIFRGAAEFHQHCRFMDELARLRSR